MRGQAIPNDLGKLGARWPERAVAVLGKCSENGFTTLGHGFRQRSSDVAASLGNAVHEEIPRLVMARAWAAEPFCGCQGISRLRECPRSLLGKAKLL
jgi:hypothetical protein